MALGINPNAASSDSDLIAARTDSVAYDALEGEHIFQVLAVVNSDNASVIIVHIWPRH